MAISDELVDEIFSWIEQSERCAEKLKKLARELESLREKHNPGVVSSAYVIGGACLFGAGVATLLTAGAASPLLGVFGASYAAASIGSKLAEDFTSSDTLKDAEKMAKKMSETEGKIKQLFLQLKEERAVMNSESDEQEENNIGQVLGAVARRSGMPCPMKTGTVGSDLSKLHASGEYPNMLVLNPEDICELVHRFTLLMEKTFFQTKSPENLVKETSAASFKGGDKVPEGAVGPAFALPVMIDNWKTLVKLNHVTEANQSLRSIADEMLEDSQEYKILLKDMEKAVEVVSQILRMRRTEPSDESSCSDEEEHWARMALLNVQSLNKKETKVRRLIEQNKLDVFLSTETWLNQCSADTVLSRASPENFSFCHQSRVGRGGGVAIQYSNEFQGKQIKFESMTFECVAMELRHDGWDAPILLINVYRPPTQKREEFNEFLKEFEKLLDEFLIKYNNILLTGDFNIHVDKVYKEWPPWEWLGWLFNKRNSCEKDFCLLLVRKSLVQHVYEPTHEDGHTLDLVITRNVKVSSLSVRDKISDHYTVYFSAMPDGRKKRCKKNKEQEPAEL